MKELDWNRIALDSGRSIYACGPTLGLPAFGKLELQYGWDGSVAERDTVTATERREIADHMIQRWQEWAEQGDHDPK